MASIKVEVEVAKESYELAMAIAALTLEIKKLMAGGTMIEKIPELVATLISKDVVDGLQGLDQIPAELKADKVMVIDAFALAGTKIAQELLKSPAQ